MKDILIYGKDEDFLSNILKPLKFSCERSQTSLVTHNFEALSLSMVLQM